MQCSKRLVQPIPIGAAPMGICFYPVLEMTRVGWPLPAVVLLGLGHSCRFLRVRDYYRSANAMNEGSREVY